MKKIFNGLHSIKNQSRRFLSLLFFFSICQYSSSNDRIESIVSHRSCHFSLFFVHVDSFTSRFCSQNCYSEQRPHVIKSRANVDPIMKKLSANRRKTSNAFAHFAFLLYFVRGRKCTLGLTAKHELSDMEVMPRQGFSEPTRAFCLARILLTLPSRVDANSQPICIEIK